MKCCDSNLWPLDETHLANNEEEYRGEEAKVKVVYSGQECRRTENQTSGPRIKNRQQLNKTLPDVWSEDLPGEKKAHHQRATQCFATFLAVMQHEEHKCQSKVSVV